MKIDRFRTAITNGKVHWNKHALERLLERGISRAEVFSVIVDGEIIEPYPDDTPYPSALISGWVDGEPIHVVAATDEQTGYCFIITVYKPDLEHFESDYKTRRKHDS